MGPNWQSSFTGWGTVAESIALQWRHMDIMRLKSPAPPLFVQPFLQAHIKNGYGIAGPLYEESTSHCWIPLPTKGQ